MRESRTSAPNRLRHLWHTRPVQVLLLVCAVLIVMLYVEENWRGQRAWERCKSQIAAQGASLDWSNYIPASVPDEQNILKVPIMSESFGERFPNDLGRRLGTLYQFAQEHSTNLLAEITIVPVPTNSSTSAADLVLQYRFSALVPAVSTTNAQAYGPEVLIPLIVMEEVPLTDAIKNLARQAEITYVMDPSVTFQEGQPQPLISARWENLTATQALLSILSTYDLELVDDTRNGVARIIPHNSSPKVRVASAARAQILALVDKALAHNNAPAPTALLGSQLIPLLSASPALKKPLRLEIQSDTIPSAQEISDFFPTNALASLTHAAARLRVEAVGTNSFYVFLGPPAFYTAAEYLAWSAQFTNEFDLIRQALNRPFARTPGNYRHAFPTPTVNMVMIRIVTQTLAQRAQCWLLAGQPEQALRELTLVHDLCRLLDPETNPPTTLVSAMIDVAVTGLYVDAIADGLRLHVWHEPELVALERELEGIDLPPLLLRGMQTARASVCQVFEDLGPRKLVQSGLFTFGVPSQNDFWSQLKTAGAVLLVVAPRGWVYQNMALTARLQQRSMEAFDLHSRTISPGNVESFENEYERVLSRTSAYNFMAALATPNFSRAWEVTAKNQTRVNLALVACALERHHLARGEYPKTLASLVPEFIKTVPADIITGQSLCYSRDTAGAFVLYSSGWPQSHSSAAASHANNRATNAIPGSAWAWQ